ncbi:MAG: hypothetical protein GY906_03450 [bacterium]|nr:hypothetical protein [bacterium]
MRAWTKLAVPLVLLLVIGACSQSGSETEADVFAEFQEGYSALETTEEKVQALEEFARNHPNNENTADVVSGVAYYRGEELGDIDGVYTFASSILDLAADPEVRFGIGVETAKAAVKVGSEFELESIITPLEEVRALTYGEHLSVMETAVELEAWDLTTQHAEQAVPFATAEQFRADYPDRDYTDEEIAERGANRKTLVASYRGWGLYNQGQVEEATDALNSACTDTARSYVGVPTNDSCRYLAAISLEAENSERAIELAAPYAIMAHDETALEIVKNAYSVNGGTESGFEEFLWSARLEQARTIDGFTATHYDGEAFELDSMQDKVVLLAFWFPT